MEKFEAPIQESLLQELIELWDTIPELPTNEEWRRELLGLDAILQPHTHLYRARGRPEL